MPQMTPQQQIELRSHEVQEIISQVPSGVIRWGMVIIFVVILLLLAVSWFIEYPDVLQAKVTITTSIPPSTLVARTNGHLVLLKQENEVIRPKEIIAYLRTNTSLASVLNLEKMLIDVTEYPTETTTNSLGEFEPDYASLVNTSLEIQLFKENALYEVQINQLRKQEGTYLKMQKSLLAQLQLSKQEIALAKDKFKMDSLLYSQKVTALVDFNKDKTIWLQQQRAFSSAETSLVNNEIQLNQLSKQISDLEIQKIEQKQKLNAAFSNSKKALLAHIAKWKETYLFEAPREGKLAYIGFKENEMFVEAMKPVFSVLPIKEIVIARAELPLRNSGKVKEGQRVNIRLENYPFEQYGAITGIVSSISLIPNEEKYNVIIALPNGLRTNQNETLAFKQQLSGSTEIITEDLRLLERFFYQFRSLAKVQKESPLK